MMCTTAEAREMEGMAKKFYELTKQRKVGIAILRYTENTTSLITITLMPASGGQGSTAGEIEIKTSADKDLFRGFIEDYIIAKNRELGEQAKCLTKVVELANEYKGFGKV